MMLQKQQQQALFEGQQQQAIEEQHRMADEQQRLSAQKIEKLHLIKNKGPSEESTCPSALFSVNVNRVSSGAIASNEVKAKLRECLLSKGHRDPAHLKNSSTDFRHW
jgi:hypothetical protein